MWKKNVSVVSGSLSTFDVLTRNAEAHSQGSDDLNPDVAKLRTQRCYTVITSCLGGLQHDDCEKLGDRVLENEHPRYLWMGQLLARQPPIQTTCVPLANKSPPSCLLQLPWPQIDYRHNHWLVRRIGCRGGIRHKGRRTHRLRR